MRVLAIETSCDDTAAAVLDESGVRASIVASQDMVHGKYGGIVPELASRQHLVAILPVIERALGDAGIGLDDVEAVTATYGPGLVGSLLVGLQVAKGIAFDRGLPFVGVNHLEGHLLAILLDRPVAFPYLGLLVSGGHTSLYLVEEIGRYRQLGRTRDDAAGEAFDKGAKMLGLGFPGGREIDRRAAKGDRAAIRFPRAAIKHSARGATKHSERGATKRLARGAVEPGGYDFSFSGVKTSLRQYLLDGGKDALEDVCASFQEAIIDMLVAPTLKAAAELGATTIVVSGGVSANSRLRTAMTEAGTAAGLDVAFPRFAYCTDNAAMIGYAGRMRLLRGERHDLGLNAAATLPIGVDFPMSRLAAETRALLQREGLAPRKSLGQHFLVDPGVIGRMVDLAEVSDRDAVLEIGPGVGALTDVLATRAARLYIVEYDRGLCVVLRRKFAGHPEVKVIEGDVLDVDLRGEVPETEVKVVASLPYNISVPILFRLIEERHVFPDLTVMLQKEVADRLLAKVDTRAYGAPSVLFQLYAEPRGRFRVGSSAFYPRPQVASEVLRVRLAPEPRVPVDEPRLMSAIVRAAFNQRRKMLRNALQTLAAPLALPPPVWEDVFAAAGVDGRARGETLDVATFARLSDTAGKALDAAGVPRRNARSPR